MMFQWTVQPILEAAAVDALDGLAGSVVKLLG